MLWEVMLELVIEFLKVSGEICKTFWKLGQEVVAYFKKGSKKNKAAAETGVQAAEEAEDARKKGQLVLIVSILVVAALASLILPPVRGFIFGAASSRPAVIVETPRSLYPMAHYTVPQLYNKMKFAIEEGSTTRVIYYYWHAPENVPPGRKLPLVVVLHGKDGMCHAAIHLRKAEIQKSFPSYLLIPQSPQGKVWDAPAEYSGQEFPKAKEAVLPVQEARSLRDVLLLLGKVTQEAAVDENRMYVIGCDEGAAGVYGALAHHPGIFAAGVAVAGVWSFLDGAKIAKTPLLILHGDQDKTVPPVTANNMAQLIKRAGGRVSYHQVRWVGHECDSPNFYSKAVWKWLFSHKRKITASAATTP